MLDSKKKTSTEGSGCRRCCFVVVQIDGFFQAPFERPIKYLANAPPPDLYNYIFVLAVTLLRNQFEKRTRKRAKMTIFLHLACSLTKLDNTNHHKPDKIRKNTNFLSENDPAKSLRQKLTELLISLHDVREVGTKTWTLSYALDFKNQLYTSKSRTFETLKLPNRLQEKTENWGCENYGSEDP